MTQALTQEAAAEWLEVEESRQVGSGRQRHSKRGNGEGGANWAGWLASRAGRMAERAGARVTGQGQAWSGR